MNDSGDLAAFRTELCRVLESAEFSGSHRLSRFLSFVSEAAFTGRDHLDQCEIAASVLENKEGFNPLDDASVRKLATLTRQKLSKYYEEDGRGDPVIITLPPRCYVPQYHRRDESQEEAVHPKPAITSRRWRIALLSGLAVILAVGLAAFRFWPSRSEPDGRIQILSQKGDVTHRRKALASDAIRLGPKLDQFEDVTARMTFTPEVADQQAGIMIFDNPDRYVKLARHFSARTQLEFGIESGARYRKTADTFTSDFAGQNGAPIWLSIRRQENRFRAFTSTDGLNWRSLGGALEMEVPMPNARVAVFAFNGLTDAPSTVANFDHVSIGVNFHSGEADQPEYMNGWRSSNACAPEGRVVGMPDRLALLLPSIDRQCAWNFSRPVPKGDWTYVTLMDFESQNGSYAGLRINGSVGEIRLIRWNLDGGVISLEHRGKVNLRDYPGSPAVYLRLDAKDGSVRASISRDGEHFEHLPGSIPLEDLGVNLRVGTTAGRTSWSAQRSFPPVNFFYLRQELQSLTLFR